METNTYDEEKTKNTQIDESCMVNLGGIFESAAKDMTDYMSRKQDEECRKFCQVMDDALKKFENK